MNIGSLRDLLRGIEKTAKSAERQRLPDLWCLVAAVAMLVYLGYEAEAREALRPVLRQAQKEAKRRFGSSSDGALN